MKIACACGATIHDAGDGLPGKAHIVPDASLFPLMDAFDEILLKRCTTQGEREAACTELRRLLIKATRPAWQCAHCGRLYIDDAAPAAERLRARRCSRDVGVCGGPGRETRVTLSEAWHPRAHLRRLCLA